MVMAFSDAIEFDASGDPIAIWTGDTLPLFQFQIVYRNGAGPADLTGASVALSIVPTTTQGPGLLGASCQIVDAENGIVQYQLQQGFTLPVGVSSATLSGQLAIDFGSGALQHTSVFTLTLQKTLGTA